MRIRLSTDRLERRAKMNRNFPLRIVEGFYGEPWSLSDRLSMIDFLGKYRFNTYIYAPKDDPYHRSKWRIKYPTDLSGKIKLIIDRCHENNVQFVFTVSPGLSISYVSNSDKRQLLQKLNFAIELGCNWLGIMLDDIGTSLVKPEDRETFHGLAEAHCFLLNSVKDELGRDIRLTFCPTYYANDYLGKKVSKNDYLETIGEKLQKDIDVMWTGRHVVSTTITADDAKSFSRVIKRDPFLWDNYPTNDYYRDQNRKNRREIRLHFGAFRGRDESITRLLSGYVSNPMNQAEASKIPLLTLSDMIKYPRSYSPDRSFEKAMRKLYGKDRAFQEIKLVARASKASPLDTGEADDIRAIVSGIIAKGSNKSKKVLKAKLESYADVQTKLENKIQNRNLLTEIRPLLVKLTKLGALGMLCLEYIDLGSNGREKIRNDLTSKIRKAANAVGADGTQVLGEIRFERKSDPDNDMGLPHTRAESPVMQLYEYTLAKK